MMELAITELVEEESLFIWCLKDYVKLVSNFKDTDSKIESPIFTDRCSKSGCKWKLVVYPRKEILESGTKSNFFQLFLKFADNTAKLNIKTRFNMTLFDEKGSPLKELTTNHEFNTLELDWGWSTFLTETFLQKKLSEGDGLKVQCRLWIQNITASRIQGDLGNENPEAIKSHQSQLQTSLYALQIDQQFADVAISTSTKTFMAHKCILAARSSVFRAMLGSNMLEASQNTIDIADFDEYVVKGMLDYIYTGEVKEMTGISGALLQIAEKYDLMGLKEHAALSLASNLNVTNAAETLSLSDVFNATALKRKAIGFFHQNEKQIKATGSFQDLVNSNPALIAHLYLSKVPE